MATNEQILDRLNEIETRFDVRLNEVETLASRNDEALRGNGKAGLKAQVAENTRLLSEIRWYYRVIVVLVVGEFAARVFGVI